MLYPKFRDPIFQHAYARWPASQPTNQPSTHPSSSTRRKRGWTGEEEEEQEFAQAGLSLG